VFLSSELDGDEWSASRCGRFTPGEITSITYRIGGWVGPRAAVDAVGKKKQSLPLPGIELWSSLPLLSHYTD
jgi:hypothetical protein